jgi:ferredoxin-nitrite reductase
MAANTIEAIKAEKDGLDVFPDLLRYACEGWEAIPEDDLERLKWYGLFHRKATPGYFMLRLRIPNGVLTSEQLEAIGEISNRCGRGEADLTSRQNIQLRWITIEDAPWVLQRLAAAGLTSQQSGMDNIRNLVGCPIAGLHPTEVIDARPLAARIQQAVIGRRAFSNLPRKFNISITGCTDDCTNAQAHDLSFQPARNTIEGVRTAGFNVLVGGALGGQEPILAQPLDVFVTPAQVVPFTTALLEVFRDEGPREKRKETRLRVLIGQRGLPWLRAAVEARLGRALPPAGDPATTQAGGDHLGITEQRDGRRIVGCCVPVGRITGDDLLEFARLAAVYGAAELRLTVQQNILVPHVSPERVDELLAEPLLQRYSPRPSPFLRGLVSCTGNDYCHFSLIDTKGRALELARALDREYEADRALRIHLSGCPHACGQHRIADVGLQGDRVRIDGEIVDAAHVFAGGCLGREAQLAEPVQSGVPVEELPGLVIRQVRERFGADAVRRRAREQVSS